MPHGKISILTSRQSQTSTNKSNRNWLLQNKNQIVKYTKDSSPKAQNDSDFVILRGFIPEESFLFLSVIFCFGCFASAPFYCRCVLRYHRYHLCRYKKLPTNNCWWGVKLLNHFKACLQCVLQSKSQLYSSFNFIRTQASCADVCIFVCTVYNDFNSLYVRFKHSVCSDVGVGKINPENNAFIANFTSSHNKTMPFYRAFHIPYL